MNLHDYDITTMAKEAGREEGLIEGAHNKAVENAKNLLKEGDSPEKVSRCIGLPLEEIKKLAEEVAAEKQQQKE
ncbi:MAG: hypothetical protein J5687_07810 [Treponema sp.]|nr:hypothetical protein [Treponema sp.]